MCHMKTISARELHHHTSEVLARVERGEEIKISKRGKLVACVMPAQKQKLAKLRLPDFAARLKKNFPNGPIKGDPQEFWDYARGE